jgi:hypothetical protein
VTLSATQTAADLQQSRTELQSAQAELLTTQSELQTQRAALSNALEEAATLRRDLAAALAHTKRHTVDTPVQTPPPLSIVSSPSVSQPQPPAAVFTAPCPPAAQALLRPTARVADLLTSAQALFPPEDDVSMWFLDLLESPPPSSASRPPLAILLRYIQGIFGVQARTSQTPVLRTPGTSTPSSPRRLDRNSNLTQ